MISATGVRIGFFDLPAHVRAALEGILGGAVVSAVSQPGGFSPGTADRVVTADGRRGFVKAISPAQNAHAPALHRRETAISGALPAAAPAPRLLGSFDDGEWVALVLDDVEGRHPATPWRDAELSAVLSALGPAGGHAHPVAAACGADGGGVLRPRLRRVAPAGHRLARRPGPVGGRAPARPGRGG
jgi:hypothetical protein